AAQKVTVSKTFDNATSCSSENGVVLIASIYQDAIAALENSGGVLLDAEDKKRLEGFMFANGKLTSAFTAQSAPYIAEKAQLKHPNAKYARFFMVVETGFGPSAPFSGEKLSPVLTVWKATDFNDAKQIVQGIYSFQGAGHSVGLHTASSGNMMDERASQLAQELPVSRVIVNQAHAIATGGSFDNGLPFSLSMGCGTWGRNNFSENMSYKHYLNISRVVRVIPEEVPTVDDLLQEYFQRFPH
ncbi:MAG: sulfoacetaldehyde dehydrogenase, partial [Burkholderiaceae bacterium]|nr:sulfoacetaldehyde dehydrogenase [Burkholderiaceae bacterium]